MKTYLESNPKPVCTDPEAFAEYWIRISNMWETCATARRHLIWLWQNDKPIPGVKRHGMGVLAEKPKPVEFRLNRLQALYDLRGPKSPIQEEFDGADKITGSKWDYYHRQLQKAIAEKEAHPMNRLAKLEAAALVERLKEMA